MAHLLVESLSEDFDPGDYEDDYAGAVEALVQAKIAGGDVETPATPEEPAGQVVDLLAALQQSVDRAKAARAAAGGSGSGGSRSSGSVSYTHLDVYKRQLQQGPPFVPGPVRDLAAPHAQDIEDDVGDRLAVRHGHRGRPVADVDPFGERGVVAQAAVEHADLAVQEEVVVPRGQAC